MMLSILIDLSKLSNPLFFNSKLIGLVPDSRFIEGVIELSQYGEIVIDGRGQTSEQGIFA